MTRKDELAKRNLFDELIALRDVQREQAASAVRVVKYEDLPWEDNPIGRMRWYLHPGLDDVAIKSLMFYVLDLAPGEQSGLVKGQGGQVVYVWEGRGYTEVNGAKHHWEEGDLINVPLLTEGLTVRHVNIDPAAHALLVHAEPNYVHSLGVDMGSGFEVLEAAVRSAGDESA